MFEQHISKEARVTAMRGKAISNCPQITTLLKKSASRDRVFPNTYDDPSG
jgi:hypothetical protein